MHHYLPLLVFFVFAIVFSIALMVVARVLRPREQNLIKSSPYECGFPAFADARLPFDIRYYLVAILFILFDLEVAFLFPWAVSLRQIGKNGFLAMAVFLGILLVGFGYEWMKGALEWD